MSEVAAPLRIDVFTIFPDMIESYCATSIVGRARTSGLLDLRVHDLRLGADDPRRSVDDSPFGGGPGMVLAPGPVFAAVERADPPRPLLLMSPAGRRFDQSVAAELAGVAAIAGGGPAGGESGSGAGASDLAGVDPAEAPGPPQRAFSLLCGRYEGVDERIVEHLVDGELSIGDYVLAGGELAALVVVESVTRLVPGVVGNEASTADESFTTGLLEYPQFTRPADFRGWAVPEVLLSGDHGRVAEWRRVQSLQRTLERRPDLIEQRGGLSDHEVQLLARHGYPVTPAADP